jgi:tetratricopeptide (TPR) repeat protein
LERQGGYVTKFIGDAVVGLFGFPTVREDDALRAVRAAGAMRDALVQLNEELDRDWGVRIGMRIGVNTGEVVISPQGLAVGDAMNTAARLEQAAPAGEVLIGGSTWRQVRHAIRAEALEPLTLKGKRSPVAAFRLLAAPATAPARVRIEAPLIGRDAELGRLLEAFERTITARACRLVSVIGSPGLGKTRLAEELATALGERATVVWGRCEPTGEGITFAPVVEVLRGAGGIGEADPEPAVRGKLAALVPDDPDAELLVERAVSILGFGAPAPAAETFWAVRRLLGALAQTRPLLVVLDDVHWGQPTFWELIEHLAEWGRHAPILLLVLARPELRELRPTLATLATRGGLAHDVLELTPLDQDQSRRLVDELLDRTEVPQALAARILTATEGNPLFLGETVRMLVDDGVLRRQADGWAITGDAEVVEVPPTISALLAARIERLDAAQRAVVEPASVIGKQFYRGAVAQLAPPPVAAGIDEHLAALRRKEVVEPEGTVWIDEPVFRFHHVLIRDAAYRGLLKEARAELHERFADWLQTKVGELVGEHEEIIAFHLEQAHDYRRQLGPLDHHGRELAARATARLHSAGRRALAREDLPAASNLLFRAARLFSVDAPELPEVLIELLEALLSAGDTAEAAPVLQRLLVIAGEDKRLSAWAGVFGAQLAELTDTAHLHEALDELTAAADALAGAGDERGVAKAQHVRAQALALLGRVGEVETVLDQALVAARRAGATRRVNAVLTAAPRAALWGPSPVMRASGRCLDVVRILRMGQGNRHVEALALRCQAVLEAMRGRTDATRNILNRCRATLEELGLGLELVETAHYTGIVELIAGEHQAAEQQLRGAYEGFTARGLGVGAAAAAARLARALLAQDRDTEAEELTRFSEAHAGEQLQPTIIWLGVRAQILARRGEHAEAEHYARRAVELASATDALVDHADAPWPWPTCSAPPDRTRRPPTRPAMPAACIGPRGTRWGPSGREHSPGNARRDPAAGRFRFMPACQADRGRYSPPRWLPRSTGVTGRAWPRVWPKTSTASITAQPHRAATRSPPKPSATHCEHSRRWHRTSKCAWPNSSTRTTSAWPRGSLPGTTPPAARSPSRASPWHTSTTATG